MKQHTKSSFVKNNPHFKSMRVQDPIQFNVLYNEWRRMREERESLMVEYLRIQGGIEFNG